MDWVLYDNSLHHEELNKLAKAKCRLFLYRKTIQLDTQTPFLYLPSFFLYLQLENIPKPHLYLNGMYYLLRLQLQTGFTTKKKLLVIILLCHALLQSNRFSSVRENCPYFEFFWSVYSVPLRIQFECGKSRTTKTPNTDTFFAVHNVNIKSQAT